MNHLEFGKAGEDRAANFLITNGHVILDRNYTWKKLEIDIISTYQNILVFTEVKTRKTAVIGEPFKAVTRTKQQQLIKAANRYILEKNRHEEVRFDVISIVSNSFRTHLEYIPDAFYPLV